MSMLCVLKILSSVLVKCCWVFSCVCSSVLLVCLSWLCVVFMVG